MLRRLYVLLIGLGDESVRLLLGDGTADSWKLKVSRGEA
jgi:hypothetical protein